MDQAKIGRFIAEQRKEQNLTQMQLAEHLGITDRAVSKWERGKSLPDASIMLELCGLLHITVNELLCGERTNMENTSKETEGILLDLVKQKEESDKRLLTVEIVLGCISTVFLLVMVFLAALLDLPTWLRVTLIVSGFVLFLLGISFCVRIEQTAGYYLCPKCGHKYVPNYRATYFAMHIGRTRYLKCPNCQRLSWQKKVVK